MDKKIIRNRNTRDKIAGELYADHDISLKQYQHLTQENQHDTALLLKGDVSYDQKRKARRIPNVRDTLIEHKLL
jgi:hypothetical protein